eukprot:CAMPEP_0182485556 /NCGR_PEP_ID=MMETSP1319-20130603/45486_1 /TAXON_ID=172717 /ORGANISM="Bolidomonas pacifica, Strain RCC208" /LENGTH=134 /DNA_ID=CAMNT_0024687547 /DNA_START=79 /DNA_END=480 /DNA_ORIENTATION=+
MANAPVAVLIEELRSADLQPRLNSINQLTTVASALGVERTRQELLPYLTQSIDDQDEILVALAEQLGNLVPHVGGGEYAFQLLVPLDALCCVEESAVRDKAVASISSIAAVMSDEHIMEHYIPLLQQLAQKDWF